MPKPPRPAPLSVRLRPEVRLLVELGAAAAGMSRNAFIDWRLSDSGNPPPRQRGKFPVKDHRAISAVMAKLGQTHFAANLNQLAKLANSGSLILTPEVVAELLEAIHHIHEMRALLIQALGKSEDAS